MNGITGFLYGTVFGRIILKILTHPLISKLCGVFLDCPASKILIRPFVSANSIDLAEFYSGDFHCFNDCFARRIKPGKRIIDMDLSAFVSPCDGLLTVYEIEKGTVILSSLRLRDKDTA